MAQQQRNHVSASLHGSQMETVLSLVVDSKRIRAGLRQQQLHNQLVAFRARQHQSSGPIVRHRRHVASPIDEDPSDSFLPERARKVQDGGALRSHQHVALGPAEQGRAHFRSDAIENAAQEPLVRQGLIRRACRPRSSGSAARRDERLAEQR